MEIAFEIEQQFGEFLRNEGCTASVKMLDKRLCEMGDLLIKSKTDTTIQFDVELLQRTSTNWPLQVASVSFNGNVAHVQFERTAAFRRAIGSMEWKQRAKDRTGARSTTPQLYVDVPIVQEYSSAMSMTQFRAYVLQKFLKNCFTHAGYVTAERDQHEHMNQPVPVKQITFVQKKNKITSEQQEDDIAERQQQQQVEILVGPVLVGPDQANAGDYIKLRSNEMQLIAQHRYGVRIHNAAEMYRIVTSLGRSASIVDVLQQKHSSTIDMRGGKIGITRTPTATKGAVFILYNFARLVSIFKKYRTMIEQEGYPRIAPVDEVDFSVLSEPAEWQLLYVYVIGFPVAMQRTLGDGRLDRIAPHHLLEFTFGLVSCLSKYYRSTRILTDNRPRLLPVMVARLHLLEAIYNVLQTLLNLLDLEPIEEM